MKSQLESHALRSEKRGKPKKSDSTALFERPAYYSTFRKVVVPILRTYPSVKIWVAGCASGEEAYSLAILLQEEGVSRFLLYATDVNELKLKRARSALYTQQRFNEWEKNYVAAGGKCHLSDYFTSEDNKLRFRDDLKKRVVFATHNLITDASFNEFQAVLCRNVMEEISPKLRARAQQLFVDSLCPFGVLGMGPKEMLEERFQSKFAVLNKRNNLLQLRAE